VRKVVVWCVAIGILAAPRAVQDLALPLTPNSIRFAVIGDQGTRDRFQIEVAEQLSRFRARFPFTFVLTLGDNLYGGREESVDFERRFERPYRALLDAGVVFHASLGNHDSVGQTQYKHFHMNGSRYYTFHERDVQFVALDSNRMDEPQVRWLDEQLRTSRARWKIAYFHHPIYLSRGPYRWNLALHDTLEPVFVKYRVNVVFSGHEHFYERMIAQSGVTYFVEGASGRLGKRPFDGPLTAKAFDADRSFILVELNKDILHFQAISRMGTTIDSGTIARTSPP
jgi:3',5'-cyclic AMP phosphodiesterase CpdA